ncbi:hypothetical protein TNIN_280321 [Trichonephila inaurata madagascariensis]|uniref:Uncharacterized protein n=1 Tax=Trichonephila inaurata madagascariensis TaxID=2747483 RepID=A0A8X6XJD1_9ARAC|nr:hypothetical protein TNIN_280321 [Trichonephila inaurata madagascariensis]
MDIDLKRYALFESSTVNHKKFVAIVTIRHFDLDCSNVKYSEDHLFQKCCVILVSNCQRSQWRKSSGTVGCGIPANAFPIRKCLGVRTQGSSGLLDNTHSGLELRDASIWLDNVDSSSKVRLVTPTTLFK